MRRLLFVFFIFIVFVTVMFSGNNDSLVNALGCLNSDCDIIVSNDSEIVYLSNVDYENIIDTLGLEIHYSGYISDRFIVEGYSNKLNDYIVVDGIKTNVQISVFDNQIIVGYPLIDNSF